MFNWTIPETHECSRVLVAISIGCVELGMLATYCVLSVLPGMVICSSRIPFSDLALINGLVNGDLLMRVSFPFPTRMSGSGAPLRSRETILPEVDSRTVPSVQIIFPWENDGLPRHLQLRSPVQVRVTVPGLSRRTRDADLPEALFHVITAVLPSSDSIGKRSSPVTIP